MSHRSQICSWSPAGAGAVTAAACSPRCVDLWREDGFTTALAWAFEADTAIAAFLTSAGWELDGVTRALDVDDLLVPQVRLHTNLTPTRSADSARRRRATWRGR